MSFPAHINKDEAEQTVGQHCRNVAEISGNHLRRLNLADTAYLAGLLHDAGKCTDEFRNYLEKASHGEVVHRGSIVHTFAAVRFLLNTYHSTPGFMTDPIKDLTVEILSSAIGGHHGLFDCFGEDGNCGFTHRMNKQPAYDDRGTWIEIDLCDIGEIAAACRPPRRGTWIEIAAVYKSMCLPHVVPRVGGRGLKSFALARACICQKSSPA